MHGGKCRCAGGVSVVVDFRRKCGEVFMEFESGASRKLFCGFCFRGRAVYLKLDLVIFVIAANIFKGIPFFLS